MGRDGQSVIEKAALVLDCYIESGESSLGYAELLEGTEINRATLHRTLAEMAEYGILVQDGQREHYRLGPLLRSAAALAAVASVPGAARPHLVRLRDECRETVVLAELHDTHVVPVLRVDGLYEIRMNQEVGRRYPAHAGATGKVLLANLPADERRDLLERLELDRLTPSTTVTRANLRADLKRIADLGVAVTIGERVPDAVAISAPVFDASGRVVAALTIGGIASRYERDALVADALAVMEAATEISAELGYRTSAERLKARKQRHYGGQPGRRGVGADVRRGLGPARRRRLSGSHCPAGRRRARRPMAHPAPHAKVGTKSQPRGGARQMTESVYRVTEVVGVSSDSWEQAAKNAVETVARTVRELRIAEVVRQDVTIEDGKVSGYRVRLGVSFKYDKE